MKRPTRVEYSTTTSDWPDKAIAILHKGFRVRLCGDSPYMYSTPYTIDPSYLSLTSGDPIPPIRIPINFDKLGAMYEIMLFLHNSTYWNIEVESIELEKMLEIAHKMNKKLAEKGAESIFVLKGSYKLEQQSIFHPKWTKWASISYWIQNLFHHKIKWSKMPGYFTRRGKMTVYVGVLPKASAGSPNRNSDLAIE